MSARSFYRGCLCGVDLFLDVEDPSGDRVFGPVVEVCCPVCDRSVVLLPNEDAP